MIAMNGGTRSIPELSIRQRRSAAVDRGFHRVASCFGWCRGGEDFRHEDRVCARAPSARAASTRDRLQWTRSRRGSRKARPKNAMPSTATPTDAPSCCSASRLLDAVRATPAARRYVAWSLRWRQVFRTYGTPTLLEHKGWREMR